MPVGPPLSHGPFERSLLKSPTRTTTTSFIVRASPPSSSSPPPLPPTPTPAPTSAAAAIALVLACGVANRVLYRLALVPMREHLFALAQFQNLGYVVIYGAIVALKLRAGAVTRPMLATPKRPFAITGLCEALAQVSVWVCVFVCVCVV
jgi:hypothetical protein